MDLVTLPDELQRSGALEMVGGITYLSSLAEAVPAPGNVEHYAQIVREKSVLRNLLIATREISDAVARGDARSRELLDEAEAKIFHIAEVGTQSSVTPFKDVLKSAFEMIRPRPGRHGQRTRHRVPRPGRIHQRPAERRTHHRRGAAEHGEDLLRAEHRAARRRANSSQPVVIFSLEMSKEQLARNMLCSPRCGWTATGCGAGG